MSKVTVIDHPLVQHKLALLRDKDTGTKAFREPAFDLFFEGVGPVVACQSYLHTHLLQYITK